MDDVTLRRKVAASLRAHRDDLRRFYMPHAKQRAFHHAGAAARERIFLAGNRVGKTLAGAAEVAFHLTGLYPDWWDGVRFAEPIRAWAASVTREATRDILQATYLGGDGRVGVLAGAQVLSLRHGTRGAVDRVRVRHVSGGTSELGFKSFDQGRARFQGTAREVIHLDEEPPLALYEECVLRTATVQGHVLLTMTPLLGLTPMVRHCLRDEERAHDAGLAVIRAGWDDAPHIGTAEQRRLKATLRPHELRPRMLGEPVAGAGIVYPVDEGGVACARFDIPPTWARVVGVDFGWTNPTAAVWLAHDTVADIVYVTDVYMARERLPAEHVEAIGQRGANIPAVCDPAGQAASQRDGASLVELYERAGLRLSLADNTVEHGVMVVLERLRAGTLRVFEDLVPWWQEFRTYTRDEKGRIRKHDDHLMDATRYAVVSGLSLARPAQPTPRRPREHPRWTTV